MTDDHTVTNDTVSNGSGGQSDLDGGAESIDTGVAVFVLPASGWLRVTGPDSTKFLDSLISQDLRSVEPGEVCFGLLLEPQGKMGFSIDLALVDENEWLVGTDVDRGAELMNALRRFLIRVAVDLVPVETGAVIEVIGEGFDDVFGHLNAIPPVPGRLSTSTLSADDGAAPDERTATHSVTTPDGTYSVVWYRSDWIYPRFVGVVTVAPAGAAAPENDADRHGGGPDGPEYAADMVTTMADTLEDHGVVTGDPVLRERRRIQAGVPAAATELDGIIPQEAGIVQRRVSFTKGCFMGQELVCRIDSRGHVNRRLVRLGAAEAVEVGSELSLDTKVVGTVTSGAQTDSGWFGLGFVRREVSEAATLTAGGVAVTVRSASSGF